MLKFFSFFVLLLSSFHRSYRHRLSVCLPRVSVCLLVAIFFSWLSCLEIIFYCETESRNIQAKISIPFHPFSIPMPSHPTLIHLSLLHPIPPFSIPPHPIPFQFPCPSIIALTAIRNYLCSFLLLHDNLIFIFSPFLPNLRQF